MKKVRQALKTGQKIYLSDNNDKYNKIYEYIIKEITGCGASCIVYEAYYNDSLGIKHLVRLKEFYPVHMGINRDEDLNLVIKEDYIQKFEEEEKFALSPLPNTPYKISEWRTAKVRPDYHISVESMFYSVPYEYINRQVDVKLSNDLVVVYFNHMWLTSHKRLYGKFGQISTIREHMPDNHKLFVDQTPEVAIEWAESIGSSTLSVVEYLLDSYQSENEKQALQSVFSLKKMERRYTKYEIERACKMVLSMTKRPTVKSIQTILKNNKKKDSEQELQQDTKITDINYGFTRGASYYGGKDDE